MILSGKIADMGELEENLQTTVSNPWMPLDDPEMCDFFNRVENEIRDISNIVRGAGKLSAGEIIQVDLELSRRKHENSSLWRR